MAIMSTTLDAMPSESPDPVHLLLIARSKVGKSTYIAQAAKDGMTVLYLDSDNGKSALRHHLAGDTKDTNALRRVHYIHTANPAQFLDTLLTANRQFRWNVTKDTKLNEITAKAEDEILVIEPAGLLRNTNFLLAIDSWTSTQANAMCIAAENAGVDLAEMERASQAVYGGAFQRLNRILNYLQRMPFHIAVAAHGTYYERYEKPAGSVAGKIKQADMVLKETIEIPLSSSRPHGVEMPKFFNHVGWLTLDNMNRVMIDFTRSQSRVGGGPPNKIALVDQLKFIDLLSAEQKSAIHGNPLNTISEDTIRIVRMEELQVKKPAIAPASSASSARVAPVTKGRVLPNLRPQK